MQLFYCESISGDTFSLSAEESHHAFRVLRFTAGDHLWVTDGKGLRVKCRVNAIDKNVCEVEPLEEPEHIIERNYSLHLAVSPTKNPSRMEWLVEKAVEIGIDEISFLHCKKSERSRIKEERIQKIVASAMKQSLRARLPMIHSMCSFDDILMQSSYEQKFIAWCGEGDKSLLKNAFKPKGNYIVLIGPEGDFTEDEIKKALASGYSAVSLGVFRLRTETAALYVTQLAEMINSE